MSRVLETVLTARNLLSPELAKAARDVAAFNSTVAGANEKAAVSASASAKVQQASAGTSATASSKAATAAVAGAGVQSKAATDVAQANARTGESATASSSVQSRAHAKAAESATLSARVQEAATRSLAASNGLLGTSLTPLTAGLGAVGLGLAYAGYRGMEFDSAMSQVQAASQATAGDMGKMRDAAIKAGADTQYSAVEAAQGITEMSKAGVSAKDILGGGLTGALNLAAAGQISVADAAETGATALSVFNLEGDQMSHVADLLAAGAGKAQGSVGDMSAALNQSALVASQAGLSIEDTAGALAMFASNGLVGSDAGTSFKTMLQALTPNSLAASQAMDAIGFSAFDAQGNFVGMESVAGQLRAGLAGLTEEQRNSTLETIFGSDAVRAASVLYKEGASGVTEWTSKVNDAGYAQDQASQLTDNLRGDLERAGGAVDSFFTSVGSGTQGPLRELVQLFTAIVSAGGDVVSFLSGLPTPVLVALGAFTAFTLLRGPLDDLFTKLAAGIVSTVTGMGMATGATTAFGIAAGVARTAVVGLLTTAAPLAAVAAITYGISEIIKFTHAGDEAKSMVEGLDKAIEDADGNEPRFQNTSSGIDELRDKIADLKPEVDSWAKENRSAFERAFIPVTSGAQDARESLQIYQDKLADLEAAQDRYGQNIDVLSGHYRISRDDVIAFADAHSIDLSGSLQIAQGDFMRLAGASIASGDAMVNGKTTAEDFRAGLEDISKGASDAKSQIDLLKTSLDVLTGANITTFQAEEAVAEAMRSATGALEGLSGKTLTSAGDFDSQSEAGAKAAETAFAYIDAANQQIATMEAQGDTSDVVLAKDAQLRDGFIKTLGTMGITGQAAEDLANKYYGLPENRTTTIIADTSQATAAVAAAQAAIDNLRGKTLTVLVETMNVGGGVYQGSYQTADGGRALGRKYQATGGIMIPMAQGGVLGMAAGGIAGIYPPNTPRVIGDNMRVPESYIPQDNSARSQQILAATAQAMGYGLTSYNQAGTGFTAAPAAMPGYAPAGVGGPGGIDYDRLAAAIVRALPEGGPLVAIGNYNETPAGPRDLAQELRYELTAKGR